MSRSKNLTLGVLCALATAGCAGFGNPGGSQAIRVAPFQSHAAATAGDLISADAAYHEALKYHAALRYDAALVSYRQALAADPAHVGARNGLGVLLSSLGRHDEAVRELEAAVAVAPRQAYLHNNLGYAYFLRGTLPQALRELEVAKQLDPSSPRVEENLRAARSRLARSNEPRKAAPSMAPAHKITPPAVEKSASTAPPSAVLILVAPQVYELRERHVEPAPPAAPAVSPAVARTVSSVTVGPTPVPAHAAQGWSRIEVANGNGLNGYARRVSAVLHRAGWETARLTNQLPYTQRVTEVQYRDGFVAEAMKLAASLRDGVLIVRNDALAPRVNLRLLLGRDAWTPAALVRHEPAVSGPLRVTEATQSAR